jgi:NDP-sugar pyrophosphorylase family protein
LQAVILAGGLGTRLWPLTKEIPKPMVPVAGLPYLEHQLLLLKQQRIVDVLLLTGYLGDRIESYFGHGDRFGLSIRYSREPEPLGTAGALREARSLLDDRFLVLYGDSYLPMQYSEALEPLRALEVRGLLVVYDHQSGGVPVPSNVALDPEGYVIRYAKESEGPDLRYVEAGVLAFRRSALDLIPASGVVSLENHLFQQLIARRELIALITPQRFYDIGTPERLREIETLLAHDHHANSISN